jgi:hypothetical protein
MNITERKLNDVTVLDLEGNLALEDNAQFRKHVTAIIDAGARNLIVNMARVKYTAPVTPQNQKPTGFHRSDSRFSFIDKAVHFSGQN